MPVARMIARATSPSSRQRASGSGRSAFETTAPTTHLLAATDANAQRQTPSVLDSTKSALWYEVNDAHHKLVGEIGAVNPRVTTPTRSEWLERIGRTWAQVGDEGISDSRLRAIKSQLDALKAEIGQEASLAAESWKADVAAYRQERSSLAAETKEWTEDALRILDDRYRSTARAVQLAGSYLTFEDLVPLEHTLREKKHREHALTRYVRANEGPDAGTSLATGAGLGAIVTYQGKTLVRLGGEKFYVSGTPPKGGWTPKGGTTSVLFLYKKSDIKKMYRLDWDTIKMGPKQGQLGWEHNQKGVSKILGLKVTNHQPAGGWGRAAGTALRVYKWGGRALFVAGLVGSAVEIYYAENKARAIAKTGGALAGGFGGAKLGAAGGAKAGSYFGPVGAGIGTFLGGLIGAAAGAWFGGKVAGYVYDLIVDRLEEEDDWVLLTEDQVEQAPAATGTGGR